jgi:hypothetical protein
LNLAPRYASIHQAEADMAIASSGKLEWKGSKMETVRISDLPLGELQKKFPNASFFIEPDGQIEVDFGSGTQAKWEVSTFQGGRSCPCKGLKRGTEISWVQKWLSTAQPRGGNA